MKATRSTSTLTGLLKRLVRRGLVARRVDASDGRRALFALTPRGEALDKMRGSTVEATVSAALESLPASNARVAVAVLDALAQGMDR